MPNICVGFVLEIDIKLRQCHPADSLVYLYRLQLLCYEDVICACTACAEHFLWFTGLKDEVTAAACQRLGSGSLFVSLYWLTFCIKCSVIKANLKKQHPCKILISSSTKKKKKRRKKWLQKRCL